MRKHFLILMLMALLPLAGFAEDLREGKMVIPSTYYGDAPTSATIKVYNKANSPLALGTDFIFDGFFSDEACTSSLTENQVKAKDAGTVIWVKVTGKDAYENPLKASFEIKKLPLLITGAFVAEKDQKVYAAAEPTGNLFTVTAIEDKVDYTAVFENKITFARESGAVLDPVGSYALNATITDDELAANYTIESEDIKVAGHQALFVITPKAFVAEGDGATVNVSVTANLTYNGEEQKATVVVTDKVLGELTEATYYTAAEATAHNAGLETIAADGAVPAPTQGTQVGAKYNFSSYDDAAKTTLYATGTAIVTKIEGEWSTVVVTTNSVNNPAFVGKEFKIHATALPTTGNALQLFDVNGHAVSGIFVDVTDLATGNYSADDAKYYNAALGFVKAGDPKDGDYFLTWDNNTNASTAANVTVRGMGNYQAGGLTAKNFTIKQATLIVTPSVEKVYDGHDNIPTLPTDASTKSGQTIKNGNVTFTFQGFVNDEDATIITINTTDALEVHVKEAPVLAWKATTTNAHVSEGNVIKFNNADINKCFATTNNNYFFYANEGTFDIKPKAITVIRL